MPIEDKFRDVALLNMPFSAGFSVDPSDTADLQTFPRALYVGVTGDVSVVLLDGTTLLLKGLVAGVAHPIRVARVRQTGTTATNIVALY